MTPAWMARSSAVNLPVELEIVLLWWLVADMTLGRLAGLYDTSAWFDKALHLGNSVLLGMLGFLAVYVLHFTGRFPAGRNRHRSDHRRSMRHSKRSRCRMRAFAELVAPRHA